MNIAWLPVAEGKILFLVQLCQICTENPDIVLLKVDFDENRDTVKPLGIKEIARTGKVAMHRGMQLMRGARGTKERVA